jgi:type IV pilus assembly protein PilM
MQILLKPITALGLEKTSQFIKAAEVSLKGKILHIHRLIDIPLLDCEKSTVHSLQKMPIATALEGCDVLVRSLQLPLRKTKDIDVALPFQAEPLLPYPVDQAILGRQIIDQTTDESKLTIFSIRKDLLQKHLNEWQQLNIEPEVVSCTQTALAFFAKQFVLTRHPYLILHLQDYWMTCLLVKEGKVLASYASFEGIQKIREAFGNEEIFIREMQAENLPENISETVQKLQQVIAKLIYAIFKELKGQSLEGILLTGEVAQWPLLEKALTEKFNLPLLNLEESEKRRYAVPIGLAHEALPTNKKDLLNFRKKEFVYPHFWKQLKIPLAIYLVLMVILTLVFYFFEQSYLNYEEIKIKEKYMDLLAAMNKSYDSFEEAFLAKNPIATEKSHGEISNIMQLQSQDLAERLEFLQKDLQVTPHTFPLFANIPKVSDVLAWLSNHPNVVRQKEDHSIESRLQIENFNYIMLKRPIQGKKQEHYQVKVELEFSSSNPTWAREFHDALIAPNDFVDPKGEVKWSTNRGRYRTSFFLRDKTLYLGQ